MKELNERVEKLKQKLDSTKEVIDKIIKNTEDRLIKPGYYDVVEADACGMRNITQFKIKVESETNLKEIALILIEEKNYYSPWSRLNIRESAPPKVFTIK